MKLKNKYIIPIVLTVVGLYLLLKPTTAKAEEVPPKKPSKKPLSAGFDTYIVTTQSSALNIRKEPNTTSPIIGSLAKGSEVMATPTPNTNDWHTLLDDNLKPKGYIASAYIKKK